jgi:subtilisin family serine protease
MVTFRYRGRSGPRYSLASSDEFLVVRTRERVPLGPRRSFGAVPLSRRGRDVLAAYTTEIEFSEAGVEVFRTRQAQGARALRDRARSALRREPSIEFAGRVLVDPLSRRPVIYTENLFVKFRSDLGPRVCAARLRALGLNIKRSLDYAPNGFFVSARPGTGRAVFDIARRLLAAPDVELCHPELIRPARRRRAFPPQWHLAATTINNRRVDAHANVEAAWPLAQGESITIAIIDDGVATDHAEFGGRAKVVAARDVTRKRDGATPLDGNNHGTACAGVACARGRFGAAGVAPQARLLPIRLASALGSQAEADAFHWAATHGADVISCSWGPEDGDFTSPEDPTHEQVVPLNDNTRLAIEFAVREGRDGKGCVVLFAAGNGGESVDNDGYASFDQVIAVAACNDKSRRSPYSDHGRAIWCAFPSNNYYPSLTPGIWTTDRPGSAGYNPGNTKAGDVQGHFTNSFGGTSSACPGAAGVAALVLARNPGLRWTEVRDVMKRSCDAIDPKDGRYDAAGHSPYYGYGRLNARRAVELATELARPRPRIRRRSRTTDR